MSQAYAASGGASALGRLLGAVEGPAEVALHSPNCTLAGTLRMVRARAPTGQGLGVRFLDGDVALPL